MVLHVNFEKCYLLASFATKRYCESENRNAGIIDICFISSSLVQTTLWKFLHCRKSNFLSDFFDMTTSTASLSLVYGFNNSQKELVALKRIARYMEIWGEHSKQ